MDADDKVDSGIIWMDESPRTRRMVTLGSGSKVFGSSSPGISGKPVITGDSSPFSSSPFSSSLSSPSPGAGYAVSDGVGPRLNEPETRRIGAPDG